MKLLIAILLVSQVGFAKDRTPASKTPFAIGKPISNWLNKPLPYGANVKIVENMATYFIPGEDNSNCVITLWFDDKGIVNDMKQEGTAKHCKPTSALMEHH